MNISEKEPIDYVLSPVKRVFGNESSIGILLFLSAVAAMVVANSSWGAEWYHHVWEQEINLSFGERSLTLDLHHFINDGLMSIFFFLVGLEIKREFLAGELSAWRKAALPIGAAIGGMVLPALIFLIFTSGGEEASGWGIPMATDIAFTLGLLNLVRNRIYSSVRVFVTSLAVVDDIGAVLVIAFFYTSSLSTHQLYVAGGAWLLLMLANKLGVRSVFFYTFVGISVIWISFFYSGIHPTIAGILLAFTIPANTRINRNQFVERIERLYARFLKTDSLANTYNSATEDRLLSKMRKAGSDARSPLQKAENSLHSFVYFIVMPLFAFSNAGVRIEDNFLEILLSPVSLGVILGLLLGKFLGISLFSKVLVWLGLAELPNQATWTQVYGVAILAGIGFTMSLFIAELAYTQNIMIEEAKSAIIVSSALAAIIGLVVIRITNKPKSIHA
jgi:NhaA family Na+:H+ antiporter